MPKKKKEPAKEPEKSSDTVTISKSELDGLKSQIEDMNKFRTETEDYLKGASVVVNTLASDPKLTKAFQDTLAGRTTGGQEPGQQSQQTQTQTTPPANDGSKASEYSKDVAEVKESQFGEIVAAFEKDYGINGMKDDDKRESRRKIESYLNDFGWSISGQTGNRPPLNQLRNQLEKAYMGTHAEKLREEGRLEGFTQARVNDQGAMGSFPSGNLETSQEAELSAGQKEWAEKLGVDPEKAKKTYADRDNEEKRVSGAEKRAKESTE